jgi:Reverse transcriptase (RNA-dependent DNA polymerase)
MQTKEVNYWETYVPVVGWPTIRLFLTMMIMNKCQSKQVDFVLAFPQADIECDMYMQIPHGFHIDGDPGDYCLKLKKNLYGQKQAGRVWNIYLHEGLLARGFCQSEVDMCVYYKGDVTLLIYTDDGIFLADDMAKIDKCFKELTTDHINGSGKLHRAFRMTDEGDLSDYLGVKIKPLENGLIKLYQPHMIKQILSDLGFNECTKGKPTPAAITTRLDRDIFSDHFAEEWNYRSIVGKLNFLEKSTRPDIAYAVHQCARFAGDPRKSHAQAIKRIGKYLVDTCKDGIVLNPKAHSFDCWVDADFVGNYSKLYSDVDPATF